jgi:hypothetical protein
MTDHPILCVLVRDSVTGEECFEPLRDHPRLDTIVITDRRHPRPAPIICDREHVLNAQNTRVLPRQSAAPRFAFSNVHFHGVWSSLRDA